MRELRLGIDIDGVLRDMVAGFDAAFREVYPERVANISLPVRHYNLERSYPGTSSEMKDLMFNKRTEQIFFRTKPYPGAREFMEELCSSHEVWIVTSQHPSCHILTLRWLRFHKIPFHSIAITNNKSALAVDYLLDDAIHNLKQFRVTHENATAVCMDQTWNQEWDGERVKSYSEFLQLINKEQ